MQKEGFLKLMSYVQYIHEIFHVNKYFIFYKFIN